MDSTENRKTKTDKEKRDFIIKMLEMCYDFFKNDNFTEKQLMTQINVLVVGLDRTLDMLDFKEAEKVVMQKLAGVGDKVKFFNPSELGSWLVELNRSHNAIF